MQHTSEQRIFVVTNYSRTISFKKVQQLFEHRFRDSFANQNYHLEKYWKVQVQVEIETNIADDALRQRTKESLNLQ